MIVVSRQKKGFTLVEILVSLGIVALVVVVIGTFQKDVFFLHSGIDASLSVQLDARKVVKTMASEIRGVSPSSLGSYPIEQATSTSFVFYNDINGDGLKERIRYFLSGTTLRRGIIVPQGSPLTYNPASEQLSTLIHDVYTGTTTPIFSYFDTNYDGTTPPLSSPINVLAIRLVKISITIDKDTTRPPPPVTITSQVNMRNLKDNL